MSLAHPASAEISVTHLPVKLPIRKPSTSKAARGRRIGTLGSFLDDIPKTTEYHSLTYDQKRKLFFHLAVLLRKEIPSMLSEDPPYVRLSFLLIELESHPKLYTTMALDATPLGDMEFMIWRVVAHMSKTKFNLLGQEGEENKRKLVDNAARLKIESLAREATWKDDLRHMLWQYGSKHPPRRGGSKHPPRRVISVGEGNRDDDEAGGMYIE